MRRAVGSFFCAFLQEDLSKYEFYGMAKMVLPKNGKRLVPCIVRGVSWPPDLTKGGLQMGTSEVLQLCLVIIGICSLFVQAQRQLTRARTVFRGTKQRLALLFSSMGASLGPKERASADLTV